MKYVRTVLLATAILSPGSFAHAASITWQAPIDETGSALDVVTLGTFFDSIVAQPVSRTVNGVTFNGLDSFSAGVATYQNGSLMEVYGAANPSYFTSGVASLPGGWDPSYALLVHDTQRANSGGGDGGEIRVNGLSVGDDYMVQIFMPFWDANWQTRFSDGVNASALLNAAVNGGATVPQYVIGTFTADAASQSIFYSGPCCETLFSAVQVRSMEETPQVPEPTSLMLLGSGAAALAYVRRRQRSPRA